MLLGIWLVASLRGGITSLDNSENMANFFQNLWTTINPFERLTRGFEYFYFGFATLVVIVFGILFGYKKSRTGFVTGFIILLMTTKSAYAVLKHLPGSQYLWMLRFISIALCMILMSFLMWDRLKKTLVLMLCVLLVVDTIPSLSLIVGEHNDISVQERMVARQDSTLISSAQAVTKQRLALMDESILGATGSWLVSDYGNPVDATFGAGREAANTSANIVNLNKAFAQGDFLYVFDRCLELGDDSVLVKNHCLNNIIIL